MKMKADLEGHGGVQVLFGSWKDLMDNFTH